MKNQLSTTLAVLAFAASAQAQNWVRSIDEDYSIKDSAVRPNGELVVAMIDLRSSPTVSRLEVFGPTGEPKSAINLTNPTVTHVRVNDVYARADGSLLVAGSHTSNHAWLAAMDVDSATVLWETTTIAEPYYGGFVVLDEGPTGLFAGGTINQQGEEVDGYLAHFDPQGRLQWQRVIGPFDERSIVTDLVATDDGGVVVAVHLPTFTGDSESHLVRFDGSGNLLWSLDFQTTSTLLMDRLADGDYLVAPLRQRRDTEHLGGADGRFRLDPLAARDPERSAANTDGDVGRRRRTRDHRLRASCPSAPRRRRVPPLVQEADRGDVPVRVLVRGRAEPGWQRLHVLDHRRRRRGDLPRPLRPGRNDQPCLLEHVSSTWAPPRRLARQRRSPLRCRSTTGSARSPACRPIRPVTP